nr:sugar transferase [Collimonas sp. OK607]
MIKRCFDFFAALIGLILLSPLFLWISCRIKLDSSGPVFFRQERVGKNNKLFRIFKFRTMTTDSESKGQITVGRDARITNVGHVIRRYKLDELPQLLNVLSGDMSLVGPRPEVPRFIACYPVDIRNIVLSVPPGITDWASIEYKDESTILGRATDAEQAYMTEILPVKMKYYVRYVQERSFGMDLKIIFRTLWVIIK